MFKSIIRNAVFGVVLSAAATGAHASVSSMPFYITYTINLSEYAVTDITMFNEGIGGFGATAFYPPLTAPVGTSTVTDPLIKAPTTFGTFLMGVTSGLPGDAPGQQDLVLFTNNAFAQSAQSIAFGTLFPNTNETALITDLSNQSYFASDVLNFAWGGDADTGPNGSIYFAPGASFTAIAFSGGQIIGSGTSSIAGVPEPSSWALMLLGMSALGLTGYRRQKAATLAA